MLVTLITGPVGSGKTSHLLDIVQKSLKTGPVRYVVPSEYVAGEIRRSYLNDGGAPLLGDVFIAWPQFIRNLSGIGNTTLPASHLTLFILHLLKSHPLRYFRPEGISLGIAREFAATILTLKHNLIDASRLRSELATRGSLRENDLLTVFERYEDERRRIGIIDDGDVTIDAASNIRTGALPYLADAQALIFDEFYHLSPGMRSIIAALAQARPDLEISIALPVSDDENAPFAPHWQRMVDGMSAITDRRETKRATPHTSPTLRAHVARSPLVELRAIARAISDDTSVIFRTGDDYVSMFLHACERYGLVESTCPLDEPMMAPMIHRVLAPETTAKLPAAGTVGEFAAHLRAALRAMAPLDVMKIAIQDPDDRYAVSRSLSAIAHLEQHLRSLATRARQFASPAIARESFIEIVRDALATHPSWQAINAHASFAMRPFDAPPVHPVARTIIPHMTEGHIPQTTSARLFFSDMDDWGTGTDSVLDELFMGTEEKLGREWGLLHAAVAKTTGEVLFTYPLIGSTGHEAVPSSFLDPLGPAVPLEAPPDLPRACATRAFTKRVHHAIAIERERSRGQVTTPSYHGIIEDELLGRMLRERFTKATFSPTSLERYAACPFQFFVEKVLGLRPEEEVTPDLLPKDRGTIIHAVLERFYRDHLEEFRRAIIHDLKPAALEAVVDELVDRTFLDHAALIGYASSSLDTYQRRAVKTMSWQVIKLEIALARSLPDPLMPAHCEWVFGEGNVPPLIIPVTTDTGASIKGCVDRIDINCNGDRFAIADYKTGSNVSSVRQSIKKGLHLQLPLYLEAVRTLLYPQAEPLGGVLIGVQQAEKKHGFLKKDYNHVHYELSGRVASLLDADAWEEARNTARDAVARYVAGIRAGRFPLEPCACNDYCDYKDICRHHEGTD